MGNRGEAIEMYPYPTATTPEEKLQIINEIKNRLLSTHGDKILAIGIYGSVGKGTDEPYSDIELHVVAVDGVSIEGHEFIFDKFKIEISMWQKSAFIATAKKVDDA